jgi:steroid delta-isomerase-like uncharacterized protein
VSDELKRISRLQIEEVFSRGNLELIDEIISPDYVIYDNGRAEPVRGRDNLKAAVAAMRKAMPDWNVEIHEQIAEGDTVVTRWTATGTHTGLLFGVEGTGRTIVMPGVDIEHFVDGQIAEAHAMWDSLGVLKQMGAIDIVIDV